MARFDLSTAMGRFRAHWHYFWADHAFLRVAFSNAHWLGPDLVRTNQPSPRQLSEPHVSGPPQSVSTHAW